MNKFTEKHKKRLKTFPQCVDDLAQPALIILFTGLPMTLVSMLNLLSMILREIKQDPAYVILTYPAYFEYILMSLCITFVGAALLDVTDKGW